MGMNYESLQNVLHVQMWTSAIQIPKHFEIKIPQP